MEINLDSKKTSTSASVTMLKPLTADDNLLWKILKEMGIPDHLLPEKPVCRLRSNSKNRTWNNGLVANWKSSTSRLYIVNPAYLTYIMQNARLDEA